MKNQINYVTQKQVLDSFNHYVDELIIQIRKVTDENTDPESISIKTRRLIEKWFRNAGKL